MYAATNGTYTLFLCEDNDPSNPRKDYEPFGRMICWHSRYNIGDNHEYAEPIDFLRDMVMTFSKIPLDMYLIMLNKACLNTFVLNMIIKIASGI